MDIDQRDQRELSAKWTLAPGNVQHSRFREQCADLVFVLSKKLNLPASLITPEFKSAYSYVIVCNKHFLIVYILLVNSR